VVQKNEPGETAEREWFKRRLERERVRKERRAKKETKMGLSNTTLTSMMLKRKNTESRHKTQTTQKREPSDWIKGNCQKDKEGGQQK